MDRYEAYLFDWDGTLARTVEIWLGVVQQCMAEYGVQVSKQQIAALYGDYQMPVHLGLPAHLNDELHDHMAARATHLLSGAVLYDGAAETLRALKRQGKRLALISNSRRQNIQQVLEHWQLGDLFETIVAQEDIRRHKPDPEALLLAAERLGVKTQRALMLGDTRNDIEAAHRASIDSLLFYPPSHRALYDFEELQTHRPTYVVHDWADFTADITK